MEIYLSKLGFDWRQLRSDHLPHVLGTAFVFGLGVWGLGFWFKGFAQGLWVWVWGFEVQGLKFEVQGLGFRIWGSGLGVQGLGLRVWG